VKVNECSWTITSSSKRVTAVCSMVSSMEVFVATASLVVMVCSPSTVASIWSEVTSKESTCSSPPSVMPPPSQLPPRGQITAPCPPASMVMGVSAQRSVLMVHDVLDVMVAVMWSVSMVTWPWGPPAPSMAASR